MSRWAEAFAALSRASDTVDTTRHSGEPLPTVSQSVHSVTSPLARSEAPAAPLVAAAAATTFECAAATWAEDEEERAAIVEHDGAVPRIWAEGFARLDPNRPPGDVPPPRWQRFIDDIGRFLDSSFCAVAAALGWTPLDLFGCNCDRPFARIDQAGLLWLLNGDRLVMLAEDAATIETFNGARLTYRPKPAAPGCVRPWELRRPANDHPGSRDPI